MENPVYKVTFHDGVQVGFDGVKLGLSSEADKVEMTWCGNYIRIIHPKLKREKIVGLTNIKELDLMSDEDIENPKVTKPKAFVNK